jgi:hypothetical protein
MRWLLSTALMLLAAGCYDPALPSPSFYCHPDDQPACPEGQMCIDGRCVGAGNTESFDFGTGNGDASVPVDGSDDSNDLAQPRHDLASTPHDFATTPLDFSSGMCGQSGASCTTDTDCCGGVCFLVLCL